MLKHYYVRAQKKVGRQNIGPYLAVAYAYGEKAGVVAKMQARFPGARIAANAYALKNEAAIVAHFERQGIAEVEL